MTREKPCYYKYSCGYDFCMHDQCQEYREKKRGEVYYGVVDDMYEMLEKLQEMDDAKEGDNAE